MYMDKNALNSCLTLMWISTEIEFEKIFFSVNTDKRLELASTQD
jgi:hypothetical protein